MTAEFKLNYSADALRLPILLTIARMALVLAVPGMRNVDSEQIGFLQLAEIGTSCSRSPMPATLTSRN